MSEPITESIPTSSFRRPAKRARTNDPVSDQSAKIDALFENPTRALEVSVGPKAKMLAAPPEIVTNVQGSSAGAGSGEFHVYKASRRREYERLRAMDEEVEKEEADQRWEELRDATKRKDDAKLSKNRARREKQKARQAKGKAQGSAANGDGDGGGSKTIGASTVKKKLVPAPVSGLKNADRGDAPGLSASVVAEADGITFLEDG